jgi:hypothetical protein
VLVLIAAACGGGDDDTSDDTAPADTAAEAPADTEAPPADTATSEPADTAPPETEAPAEELTASDVGVTEDTISIGIAIADLEAVRAAGISIPETLTTEHLFDRWNKYAEAWNADGGINGRQIEFVQVTWDPLDPASFDELCAEASINQELFMVLNGTGLNAVAMQCLVDAGVPVFYGDVVAQSLLDSGLMVTLAPSTEVVARAGIKVWLDETDLAAGAKVGVLASNSPSISAAGAAAQEALEEAGYDVELIETNSLAGDNAATQEEAAAAVGTFLANGVEHAFVTTPFTENGGFWTAAAGQLEYTLLDTASSQCSPFGLSRAPANAGGSSCVTAYDHSTSLGSGIRPDSDFEAECRAFFDENFSEYYGGPSNPGVPAGQKITDAAGTVLVSDYAPQECTMSNVLLKALTNGGVNPTRDSVLAAMLDLGEVPMALASNGTGTLRPDKPYAADQVHTVVVTIVAADTAPGDNGTYNGCAAPVSCGIVTSEWVAIE